MRNTLCEFLTFATVAKVVCKYECIGNRLQQIRGDHMRMRSPLVLWVMAMWTESGRGLAILVECQNGI